MTRSWPRWRLDHGPHPVVHVWWESRMSPLPLDFRRYVETLEEPDFSLPIVVPN